jgi:predicted RNase H-like HicB family nuclease
MKKKNFVVIIERDEDGIFIAEVPDLKGCYTQGNSIGEVMKNIKEVIEMCLEEQDHDIIPNEFIGIQKIEV